MGKLLLNRNDLDGLIQNGNDHIKDLGGQLMQKASEIEKIKSEIAAWRSANKGWAYLRESGFKEFQFERRS